MIEWNLAIDSIRLYVPIFVSVLIGAFLVGVSVFITRIVTKEKYESLLENRLNEVSDNIVFKYKQKVIECTRLQSQLEQEKLLRKSANTLISKLIEVLTK